MDRRLLLFAEVFLSLWCLSLQQGTLMTLCRGNSSVLARCGVDMTPFPGELPPGWGRMCEPGATQCDLSTQSTVESTQHYDQYQCDAETWNLNYLCLRADETVDICQDVNRTRVGNTYLVHGQLMAPRDDNVTCTCVVAKSPDKNNNATQIFLYMRHLVHSSATDAASCQGKLTLRDSLRPGPTLCLLTTRPTRQNSSEVGLGLVYAPYLNETSTFTITYELNGGAAWGQDQLLPFVLRLSGNGRYDIACGRLDDDVTESTGSAAPTATSHTNREFESTSIDNPTTSSSATDSGNGGEDAVTGTTVTLTAQPNKGNRSPSRLTIGLAVALGVVVLVVLVIGVCCFLRRRRMARHKPPQADDDRENSANLETQMRNSVSESLGTDTDLGTPASTQRSIRSQAPEGAPPPGPLVIRDVRSRKAHKGPYAVVDIQSGVDVTSAIIKDGDVGELRQEADVGSPYELAKATPPLAERKDHAVNNNYIAKDDLEDDHTSVQSLNTDNVAGVGRPDDRDVIMDNSDLYDKVHDRDVHPGEGQGQEGDDDVDPYSVTLRRNRKDEPPPESDHESGRPREAEGRPQGDEGRDGSDTEAGSGGGEATGGDGVEVDSSDTYATVNRSRKDRDSADLIMQENTVYGSHSQPIEN